MENYNVEWRIFSFALSFYILTPLKIFRNLRTLYYVISRNAHRLFSVRGMVIFLTGLLFAFCIFAVNTANAATLYFSPSSGNFSVGNVFTVNVLVNTENADINNVEATVNFPSGLLEIISISKSGSIFSLWVEEPTFSNSAGTLSLNGGLPTPGYKGANGKVIGAVFRVKKAGSASLVFSSTAVRANDGYGTDIFRTGAQAQFNLISEERLAPTPAEEAPPIAVSISRPVIRSSTHPDEDKWYSNSNPLFGWDLPSSISDVTLVLSTRANSPPIINYSPPISEKALTDIGDGTWYLNARFRNSAGLSPITSFRFNIDTQSPRDFNIVRLDTDDPMNPQPYLTFATTDDVSGIDRYEMKIGDGDWFNISPDLISSFYKLPLQYPGIYDVIVRAFDKAGNYSEAEYRLEVQSIEPPIIDSIEKPEVKVGEPLTVFGKANPSQKIIVAFRASPVVVLETAADMDGYWKIKFIPEELREYKVVAKAVDERGAISVDSNHMTFNVKPDSIPESVLNVLKRGFDSLINFIKNGWFLILLILLTIILIYILMKKVVPAIKREIRKIKHIMEEYYMDRKLKKEDRKIGIEIRMIAEDIKKELDLLKKIENHRRLHPDEKYLRDKLEKYHSILRKL